MTTILEQEIAVYTVKYDAVDKVIRVNVQGPTYLQDLLNCITEIARLAKQEDCFVVLTDLRKADLQLSVLETYQFPERISAIARSESLSIYKFKRAIVVSQDHSILGFYETVCRNRHHNVMLFHEVETALCWLCANR